MRPLGRKREQQALAQAEQPVHAKHSFGQDVAAVRPERQRLDPQHRSKIERRVKMREQRAAARSLPFQVRPKPFRIDREQHKPGLAREMAGERALKLMGGGEMDEAVAEIVGGAGEAPWLQDV